MSLNRFLKGFPGYDFSRLDQSSQEDDVGHLLVLQVLDGLHDVTRGGILETLLEIAYLSNLGIELESSQLPIPSIVARFGEVFGFDPLRMISSGTLAVTVPTERVKDVRKVLEDLRTPFAFVGQVIEGVGVRLLRDDTTLHYTEIRCEEDELARLWSLYPRKG